MIDDERKSLAPFLLGQFSRGEFAVTFVSERRLGVNEPVSAADTVLPERPRPEGRFWVYLGGTFGVSVTRRAR
jgi:hypothetical protein